MTRCLLVELDKIGIVSKYAVDLIMVVQELCRKLVIFVLGGGSLCNLRVCLDDLNLNNGKSDLKL
jgi:hypothetical protein